MIVSFCLANSELASEAIDPLGLNPISSWRDALFTFIFMHINKYKTDEGFGVALHNTLNALVDMIWLASWDQLWLHCVIQVSEQQPERFFRSFPIIILVALLSSIWFLVSIVVVMLSKFNKEVIDRELWIDILHVDISPHCHWYNSIDSPLSI